MKKFLFLFVLMGLLIGCNNSNTWDNYGYIQEENVIIFPNSTDAVNFDLDTLGEEIPSSKDDGSLDVIMRIQQGSTVFTGYGSIKVQGSSTALHPKKNWSIDIYSDKKREDKLYLKMGTSVPSDKWILKADWVDPSQLRNPLSYNLWEEMTLSRNTLPKYEVDNFWYFSDSLYEKTDTGAKGFPIVYPAIVQINSEHYGISSFMLGKDLKNYNINKDNEKHMLIEFDGRGGDTLEKSWEKFSVDGIDQWIDMLQPKSENITSEQINAIDSLSNLFNNDLDYFIENFDRHLDRQNMIDMLLLLEATLDIDAYAQDIYMVTYDLEKWYFLPWDKDTTFAMSYDGTGIVQDIMDMLVIDYENEWASQKPWYKTYHAFQNEVESRYAELRDSGVFTPETIYNYSKQYNQQLTQKNWDDEINRWAEFNRGGINETSPGQITRWFESRLNVLDKQFNYNN